MRHGLCLALLTIALLAHRSDAGEIPGMPSKLPPFLDSRFELALSNDFLGRGGGVDDFRTQQFAATSYFGARWLATADYSVLTLTEAGREGRIDQVSASLGYRLTSTRSEKSATRILAGFGIRSAGDFRGEEMQNGFHRLIGSDVEFLPYSVDGDTVATAWLDADHYAGFKELDSGWRFGYWLRGRALATSGGQFDSTVSAAAVASLRNIDIWAGLRQDWRNGYSETVQRETARAEQDTAGVIGVRFGSMIIETIQQFEQEGSFGQLRFVSLESAADDRASLPSRVGVELGFLLPDVHLHLQGRVRSNLLARDNSRWHESIIVSLNIGEPQYPGDNTIYIRSRQVAIGLEWERPVSTVTHWLSGYGSASIGWRREQLIGDGPLLGVESGAADSGVAVIAAGLRFHASTLGGAWRYRIQTGLTAWLPFNDTTRTIGTSERTVLDSSLGFSIGLTFDFT